MVIALGVTKSPQLLSLDLIEFKIWLNSHKRLLKYPLTCGVAGGSPSLELDVCLGLKKQKPEGRNNWS